MTHVITRSCCNDAACVSACPANCIHPTPGDPDFGTAEMLYIDPRNCIDCGACVEVCPVSAILPDTRLGSDLMPYLDINRRYFDGRTDAQPGFVDRTVEAEATTDLNVAVVGSGPSAMYAVEHLLDRLGDRSEIHVFERQPTPWGLVRYGVAPDHQDTKQVARGFERLADDPRVSFHLNVEVGSAISADDLRAHFHAVIYGVGAPTNRPWDVPGEELSGCLPATDFVAWYNGHPDGVDLDVDLSGSRAVVVGNGNVALDVARVLAHGDRATDSSDISEPALHALASSTIEEVVVLGRRGPSEAAFTTPELLSLLHIPGVEVLVDPADLEDDLYVTGEDRMKTDLLRRVASGEFTPSEPARRRIVLRFLRTPVAVLGEGKAEAVTMARNALVLEGGTARAVATGETEELECSLVIHAVGYRATQIHGLPFDERAGRIPSVGGRIVHDEGGAVRVGSYVVGWSKRGPSGVIGTNKSCANETVLAVLDDSAQGLLVAPRRKPGELISRLSNATELSAWRTIDRVEREAGRQSNRPRVKVVDRARMLELGRA